VHLVFVHLLLVLVPIDAMAHGGGIDKCGGHKDKKHGGYHVHQQEKWCSCNPEAAQCKASKAPEVKK
jgi:hypothetical protein